VTGASLAVRGAPPAVIGASLAVTGSLLAGAPVPLVASPPAGSVRSPLVHRADASGGGAGVGVGGGGGATASAGGSSAPRRRRGSRGIGVSLVAGRVGPACARSAAEPPQFRHTRVLIGHAIRRSMAASPIPKEVAAMATQTLVRLHVAALSALAAARRDERGQGTVEYVALILLLALVFAAVVKTGAGKDFEIGKTIVTKLKEAIDGVGDAPEAGN